LRHCAALDQHQVAEKLQISIAGYSKIETGRVKSEEAIFEELILLFGLSQT